MRSILRPALLVLSGLVPLAAQAPKKVLTQVDWDRWESIQQPSISANGRWAAYTISPQLGDAVFVVRSTSGNTEHRIPVGYTARANNNPGGLARANLTPPAAAQPVGTSRPTGQGGPFTGDGRYVLIGTQAPREAVERAQAATRAAAAANRNGGRQAGDSATANRPAPRAGSSPLDSAANRTSLVIVALESGQRTEIPHVRSYRLPARVGNWITYTADSLRAPGDSARGDSAQARTGGGAAPPPAAQGAGRGPAGGGAAAARGGSRRTMGNTLWLRNLDTGAEEKLSDVVFHTFDDSAKVLVYTIGSRTDSLLDGLYVRNLATGEVKTVMAGPGNYRGFTFDRNAQRFMFSSDRDGRADTADVKSTLYLGNVRTGAVEPIIAPSVLPDGATLSDNFSFNRAGTAATVSLSREIADSIIADSLVGKANFDLWHYKDVQLQPAQKLGNNRSRTRNYQAVYHFASRKLVPLATDTLTSIQLSDDAKVGLSNTSVAYDMERLWGDDRTDVYTVDPATGATKMIARGITGSGSLSVGGRFAVWFDIDRWYGYNIATGKTVDLTGPIPGISFARETWDTPAPASPWGVAGWTTNDRAVLIYDRWDLWEIDPLGVRAPVNVTAGAGRNAAISYRVVDLEQARTEERAFDPAKPIYFRAFNENTKASGFAEGRLGSANAPRTIVMDDVNFGNPTKARDAGMYLFTKSTFLESPNLWVGPSLTQVNRISDINQFQKEYNWGTVELVSWLDDNGKPLQGLLFKPENFDPSKKYPMISYFYEQLSNGLHNYVAPNGRNVINATHYVSNGYLIFMPDINYETGFPGDGAMKSIVPGVKTLLATRDYIDPKGLGLQGQSWGGYQIAYMITRTNLFRAAMAGAPVANMTSAYGGIRWGSGLARAFQYENTQSRIGQSVWEAPELYIENSPLFFLDRVNTPLFIMHNDQDDAVPWYQGIELFVGLKRLGREVYMINYLNDVHNPSSRANQKDMAMRMQQFFDAKLKGAPEPDWMTNGIHQRDKGRDLYTVAPGQ